MKNTSLYTSRDLDALQARFALRIAARLTENAENTSHDVTERLRFARERALQRAEEVHRAQAPAVQSAGGGVAVLLGGSRPSWWLKLASIVPLLMLLVGLSVIEELQDRNQISAAAEIDVALLADRLPPDAYQDPGFAEFLKTSEE